MAKHKYYWSKIQKWSSTTSNLRVPKNSTYGTAKSSSYPLETCLLADPPYNSFFLPNLCSCDSPMVAFKIRPQIFFPSWYAHVFALRLWVLYHRWNLFLLLWAGFVTSSRRWHRWYHDTMQLCFQLTGIHRNITRKMFTKCW